MDANWLVTTVHEVEDQVWIDEVNAVNGTGRLCEWVSTFHPNQLSCQIEGTTFYSGGFNAGLKMVFSDNSAWMVRFPFRGKVSSKHADEKVAMEVAALKLIRDRTDIPVPIVHSWGLAASNTLGLGPFIMMDFIEGVHLSRLIKDVSADPTSRRMRNNISTSDLETIYRQMARFLLQMFGLDFDQIGSLPWPEGEEVQGPTLLRPLTFKAHSILQTGGVDTFGDRHQGFATTTEYFQYILQQDWEQVDRQPNSVVGPKDARSKFLDFQALQGLARDLINPTYDDCKFKLICDDLGLANLIVRSETDLTVIGVIDLEWSYIGPAQLFGSAPWWLLQDRPVNEDWDCPGGEIPEIADRYLQHLAIFMRVLEEEEAKSPEHQSGELSSLVKWSQTSGAMWLHMFLISGFNDQFGFPFTLLLRHVGDAEWDKRREEFNKSEMLEEFATRKVRELKGYDEAMEKIEEKKELMNNGDMTKKDFVSQCTQLLQDRGYL